MYAFGRYDAHREEVMVPALKPMRSPGLSQDLDPRPQIQVIRVVEDQRDAEPFHLLRRQALDGCLCSDGHERRQNRHAVCANNLE